MKAVLHVIRSPRAEGTVRLTLDWLEASSGLRQSVFALSAQPGELTGELRRAAHSYYEQPQLPIGWRKFPWIVWQVWRVARRERPDVVICWNTGFAWVALLGAWLAGADRLLAYGGNPPVLDGTKARLHAWLSRVTFRLLGARLLCCSHYVGRQYRTQAGFPEGITRVVWNCAQVQQIRVRAEEARQARIHTRKTVLMVATLERHKDHATLLRAFVEVLRNRPGVCLRLAGNGSLRTQLIVMTEQLGLSKAVEFLGSRMDVPELLGQADLFVFSTTPLEGLGTVLIEALAARVPVVASDVPACRELLENGRWGKLVPAGDAQSLAAAIIAGIDSPTQSAVDQDRYLQNFTVAAMQAAYLDVPERV
jgi:glycosyltransferase involved in cell wall biosynthesis